MRCCDEKEIEIDQIFPQKTTIGDNYEKEYTVLSTLLP